MTIINLDAFREARAAGFDGVFDWDYLLPAFAGTKCQPMDFDGVVERNGRFLVFETKEAGKRIPQGQWITLHSLLSLNKKIPKAFTVFHIEGKTWKTLHRFTCYQEGMNDGYTVSPVSPQYVLAMTRVWFVRAHGGRFETDPWWDDYDKEILRQHKLTPLRDLPGFKPA